MAAAAGGAGEEAVLQTDAENLAADINRWDLIKRGE